MGPTTTTSVTTVADIDDTNPLIVNGDELERVAFMREHAAAHLEINGPDCNTILDSLDVNDPTVLAEIMLIRQLDEADARANAAVTALARHRAEQAGHPQSTDHPYSVKIRGGNLHDVAAQFAAAVAPDELPHVASGVTGEHGETHAFTCAADHCTHTLTVEVPARSSWTVAAYAGRGPAPHRHHITIKPAPGTVVHTSRMV
jgi:hypothetical protein